MGSRPSRLALSLLPGGGEAFDSYLERLAWRHRCSVAEIAARTGLTATPGSRSPVAGYWVTLAAAQLEAFAAASGVPGDVVGKMLLRRFDGICLDELAAGASFRGLALREWAYLTGSHACSLCLARADPKTGATGVWNIRWRLPWSFACVEHRLLLVDRCQCCGRRLRGTGRLLPSFATHVLAPGTCRNAHRSYPGAAPAPCGFNLASLAALPLEPESPLLATQQLIDNALDGKLADTELRAREWFGELRSLCALILASAEPADLICTESAVTAAFAAHAQMRAEHDRYRRALSLGSERARRLRVYMRAPQQPALMAGVASLAVAILTGDHEERAVRLALLVERLRRRQPRAVFQLERNLHLSPRLARELRPHVCVHVPGALDRLRHQPQRTHRFTAAHVPQLLDEQLFARHFEPLLDGAGRDFGRRFCSLALVRYRQGCTWEEAAAALDLPTDSTASFAYAITGRLDAAGQQQAFVDALARAAAELDAAPLTNYRARRHKLATLTDLDPDRWRRICEHAHVPAGKPTGRRYAAAWLWCQITGGDYRLAPALQEDQPRRAGEPLITRYTRWLKRHQRISLLAPHLHAHGIELLRGTDATE